MPPQHIPSGALLLHECLGRCTHWWIAARRWHGRQTRVNGCCVSILDQHPVVNGTSSFMAWGYRQAALGMVQAIMVMRGLRLMRLVRLIARSPSMLNVVQSISLSIKEMSNVVLIQLLIITVFAILGVQLFAGKLYSCNDPSATGKADCVGELPPHPHCMCTPQAS